MTAAALLTAATAAKVGGQAAEGLMAVRNANYQARAMEAKAAGERQQAGSEIAIGLEDADRRIGEGITQAAKGGGLSGGGSAIDVLGDLARQAVFRARSVAATGAAESEALRRAAKTTRTSGYFALAGQGLKMGGTILGAAMGPGGGGKAAAWNPDWGA